MVGYISVQILGLLVVAGQEFIVDDSVAGQEFNMDDSVAGQEFNMEDSEIVNFPLDTADGQTSDAVNVEGLAGGTTELPCDLKPQIPGDELLLVLWYKIGFASPVYTFDVRNRSPGSARHYSDRTLFDEPTRAVMRAVVEPSALVISNLIPGDQGVYKCRADFKRSPTKHNLLNLTVIVPPHPPLIYDENGRRLNDEFGPILLGGKVDATCVSNGGKPEPSLQWWRGNKLLDDKSEIVNGQSVNTVHLENIKQDDQGAHISCRAINSNGSNFAYRKLKLTIAYPPDKVWIEKNSEKLTAGEESNFTCRAVNSSGPTTFRWFIGKRELVNHNQSKDNQLFAWVSRLRYTPRPGDHKANISCSVLNQLYPGQPRQHKIMLTVRYSPILSIKLGHSLLSEKIQAGEDVYFTCSVDSNPPTYNLTWRHNGKFLSENKEDGILFGNHSLVLQGVKRKRSGLYTCIASNAVGDGESNAVSLDIKYSPECKIGGSRLQQAKIGESVKLQCKVDSHPVPNTYYWSFKPSNQTKFSRIADTDAEIDFFVTTEKDFGSVGCRAENSIGIQEQPCLFLLHPSISPSQLTECIVRNISYQSIYISCSELQDLEPEIAAELEILYLGEISSASIQTKPIQIQNSRPEFWFDNLESEQLYTIKLYTQTSKGPGPFTWLEIETLKNDQKPLAILSSIQDGYFDTVTFLGILLGGCVTLTLTVVGLLWGIHRSRSRPYQTVMETVSEQKCDWEKQKEEERGGERMEPEQNSLQEGRYNCSGSQANIPHLDGVSHIGCLQTTTEFLHTEHKENSRHYTTLRFPSDSKKKVPFYLDGDLTFMAKSKQISGNGEKVGIQTGAAAKEVGARTKLQTGAGTGARPRCQYGSLERYPQQQQQINMRLTVPRTLSRISALKANEEYTSQKSEIGENIYLTSCPGGFSVADLTPPPRNFCDDVKLKSDLHNELSEPDICNLTLDTDPCMRTEPMYLDSQRKDTITENEIETMPTNSPFFSTYTNVKLEKRTHESDFYIPIRDILNTTEKNVQDLEATFVTFTGGNQEKSGDSRIVNATRL